jgi:hypothetical protein
MFTVGYYFLPILNIKNNNINASFYIDKLVYSIKTNANTVPDLTIDQSKNQTANTQSGSIAYKDINMDSKYKMIFEYLYYGCIITSCFIIIGIIVSYLRLKLVSKILFILAQTFMTTFVGIIVFIYYSDMVTKMLPINNMINKVVPDFYNNIVKSYESGGILMIIASAGMVVNYILYSFIG